MESFLERISNQYFIESHATNKQLFNKDFYILKTEKKSKTTTI